ncbi:MULTISPECIES: isocitrate/isopropylmalate dehydrogenase family protein [Acetobacter]|jgi:isocitrate dehydrogenase (NAD+)|uniref:Isocitrate dehydrogenase, NAD-dependent n=1 Tax=Acetobacter peroxydans TaxID=104098 RepID=A0A4Y3TRL2_9PROT|nr:isocitrate/isopropylmalate family dehydrogenase [Acetobacter peroxydans]MCI1394670.1 isocitrate/isopropylmalate family dehydrogenase [Acetobacter peroxydans]MCI1410169.1 isocitrate/isopropylmalate family dehydrogenase [Acetobacter peroxydans]MCI1440188.1 isocitrate/isopropylmalate family dehydrogenase [Acetobacter peroxydans]MCI1565930.1 isocitrate/isopropylmalate family dehydrogenase [Acetobacter peroxydans]MCI1617856.1 isocitrate/isopropylmalate family dehydrogenase [Acetobacter peroxydan
MTADSKTIPATLIAGDGIGPEIVESVIEILDAVDAPFAWDRQLAGMAGVDAVNDPLPKQTIESIRRTGLALKGPLTTPVGGGFKSINVTLRQEFGLFANVRPTKTIVPGGKFEDIDLVIFRENLEGYYAAMEHYIPVGEDPKGIALSSGFTSRAECRRIVKYAFEYAVQNNRKTVTIVHKANILKLLTGLFLEEGRKVAEEYKGRVEFNERIVDACAMQLVINPWQFDVIVTTNLFGDILSDLTAGLVGGLGMAPGANIGEKAAVFEAVHGSAPDIAGKGIANPLALLLAAVMMLRHVGRNDMADRIDSAIAKVITSGAVRTRDLGGTASTKDLTAALKQALV